MATDRKRIAEALGLHALIGYLRLEADKLEYRSTFRVSVEKLDALPARIEAALRAASYTCTAGIHEDSWSVNDGTKLFWCPDCVAAGIAELEGSGDG